MDNFPDAFYKAEIHAIRYEAFSTLFHDALQEERPISYLEARHQLDDFNKRQGTQLDMIDMFIATLEIDMQNNEIGLKYGHYATIAMGRFTVKETSFQLNKSEELTAEVKKQIELSGKFVEDVTAYFERFYPSQTYDKIRVEE